MNIYSHVPYTYLIGWSKLDKWYYGVRYSNCGKNIANPKELWRIYFTSSKVVKSYRKKYGEPDIIQIRKTFIDKDSAIKWESIVLRRLNAANSEKWLNLTNGNEDFRCKRHNKETKELFKKRKPSMLGKFGPNHVRYGKPSSEETKRKQSISIKKSKYNPNKMVKLYFLHIKISVKYYEPLFVELLEQGWSMTCTKEYRSKHSRDNNLARGGHKLETKLKIGNKNKGKRKGYKYTKEERMNKRKYKDQSEMYWDSINNTFIMLDPLLNKIEDYYIKLHCRVGGRAVYCKNTNKKFMIDKKIPLPDWLYIKSKA